MSSAIFVVTVLLIATVLYLRYCTGEAITRKQMMRDAYFGMAIVALFILDVVLIAIKLW